MANYDDVYTMTPGSAVADTLQNILARQQAERRQSMIDALGKQNIESEIRARDEQTRSQAEVRAANAANRQAEALKRKTDLYTPGQELSPDDTNGMPTSLVKPGAPGQPGFTVGGEGGNASEDFEPIPQGNPTYVGRPDQIEKKTKDDDAATARAAMNSPQFQALPDVQKWEIIRRATGAAPPESVMAPKGGTKKVYTRNADGSINPRFTEVGRDDVVEPQMPRVPQEHGTYLDRPVMIPDPNNPGKMIQDPNSVYMVRDGQVVIQKLPNGAQVGPKPPTGGGKPVPLYDQKLLTAFQNTIKPGVPPEKTASTLQGYINSIRHQDPEEQKSLQDDVKAILKNKETRFQSVDNLVKIGYLKGTPDHIRLMDMILSPVQAALKKGQ